MDFNLLKSIRKQVEPGIIVSFHRDGEPTFYPRLREALDLFEEFTTSIVTHGETLGKLADTIIGRCTTVTVSVFRGDPDSEMQLSSLKQFLEIKGARKPQVLVKIVGDMDSKPFDSLPVRVIHRLIHIPGGNTKFAHKNPTVPEVGVCLDFLGKPTIDWRGRVFMCNRLDPHDRGYLGDLSSETLNEIWNGRTRMNWLAAHKAGRRDLASGLCRDCKSWGVPSGR